MSKAIPSLSDLISFTDFEKILKQSARKRCEKCPIKEQKKAESDK